jgi:hypothetical protein
MGRESFSTKKDTKLDNGEMTDFMVMQKPITILKR